jgi:hypothetical protein
LEAVNARLASRSPASAWVTSALAFVCTASTAASPTTPPKSAAATDATAVRFRFAHRRTRRDSGSRQAETGSSAAHRSMSSANARQLT